MEPAPRRAGGVPQALTDNHVPLARTNLSEPTKSYQLWWAAVRASAGHPDGATGARAATSVYAVSESTHSWFSATHAWTTDS